MTIEYASITEDELYSYEKLFFEDICLLDTSGRDSFSVPLPAPLDRIHFACVQDTVERLTKETGRLSVFQWRNCLFVPIEHNVKPNDIYDEVFEVLRNSHPSLFIRSYVYVIFIKTYGDSSLDLGQALSTQKASKKDLQIYAWNTNYDVRLQGKQDLFNLKGTGQSEEDVKRSNKVFIVKNPGKELNRIQDANSDVIDAARAFLGEIDLVSQTEVYLGDVSKALDESDRACVLLEGPARSGKTIVAMSLLAKYPNSKMLLMNWYFYDALVEAFKVWSKLDEDKIKRMFSADDAALSIIRNSELDRLALERFRDNPLLLDREIFMRRWGKNKLQGCPRWAKFEEGLRLTNIRKSQAGDFVFALSQKDSVMQMMRIEQVFTDSKTATASWVYSFDERDRHLRKIDDPESNARELDRLLAIKRMIDEDTIGDAIAKTIKDIADAISKSEQRFFHHDLRHINGRWIVDRSDPKKNYIDSPRVLIGEGDMVICDEAQRLGAYVIDEAEELAGLNGKLFLCGDDCQMLNRRGDLGIQRVLANTDRSIQRFHLPDSLGIPKEIGILVKCLLGDSGIPEVTSSYEVKLIFDDDTALIAAFEKDPSYKKHYALPVSSGFFGRDYRPGIRRSSTVTPECTEDCGDYCIHKFIPMLSPISDPEVPGEKPRKDLSIEYKFFCAEGIMPKYALSAYELISREVESIYLKIPAAIDTRILSAPLETGDDRESWIKRHLYVLMTRAKTRLVINIEHRGLYDHLVHVCQQAGLNTAL